MTYCSEKLQFLQNQTSHSLSDGVIKGWAFLLIIMEGLIIR